MFSALPCSTDLKQQFSWVSIEEVVWFYNLPGNKEMISKGVRHSLVLFIFFSPPKSWVKKTSATIFQQCLTHPLLSSAAFLFTSSRSTLKKSSSSSPYLLLFTDIVSLFTAEHSFLEKNSGSTWLKIAKETCYSSQSRLASYNLSH